MRESTQHLTDAGKITVLTAVVGVFVFACVFLFNLGENQVHQAEAQDVATTSVTVVNTPPAWTNEARELFESSTTSPTNAGDVVTWIATGTDANSEPYYLLVCKTSAAPTANSAAAPNCDSTTNQWAVSTSTVSGTQALVSTTTQAAWSEANPWFAWICDDNVGTPRCNAGYRQGTSTPEYASPFEVNHRPSFSLYSDNSPGDPGTLVTFYSTSSDSDTSGTADTVQLWVCNEADFNTTTNQCGPGGAIASSTLSASDASAGYTIVIPTQDQDYTAYGYVIDNHGFEASGGAQGTNSTLSVNNVAPTVDPAQININGGVNLTLTVEAGQTTGYTLRYTAIDNNSCENASSTREIIGGVTSLYRSGIGSTTCDGTSGSYDANNCYPSGVATTTWNFSCTASTTSCTGPLDTTQVFDCTFPLWYIADPTDGTATSTQYPTQNWLAAIQAVDDDAATGTKFESTSGVEVVSFLAFALNTITIPYGSLEPGQQTDPIVATTTLAATGNVGLDERLTGKSMCPTYTSGFDCPNSATSTIPESEQVYGTSTVSYGQGVALSSTTLTELELNVPKSTSTVAQATANTYWGIRVPGTITLAGNYTGENTFYAIVGESANW